MPRVEYAEPGGEYLLPWVRQKLRYWHDEMLRSGQHNVFKTVHVSDGAVIYASSLYLGHGVFQDRVRVTASGGYVIGDPYQPLWNIESALMPGALAGVVPALAWSPTVQHITSYFPNADGSYLRRHWLVICRYCKRVAEYTWDETKTLTTPTNTIVGEYVSHAADGSTVTVRDTDAEGVGTVRVVTITPSLTATSTANVWGWIDGDSVSARAVTGPVVATTYEYVDEGFDETGNHIILATSTTTFTIRYADDNSIASQASISGTQHTQTYFDGTHGAPNGFIDIETIYTGSYVGISSPYITTAGTYWNEDVVPTSLITAHASYVAAVASAAADNAAYDSEVVTAAKAIVSGALDLMNAKKIGSPEVAELRPYDEAVDHRSIRQALVIPAYSATQFTFSKGAASATLDYNSVVLSTLIPSSIYGVSIGVSSPAVPPAPSPPWVVTVSDPLVFTYTAPTKSFAAAGTLALTTAYFSRGIAPPLVLGQTAALGHTGLYNVSGSVMDEDVVLPIASLGEFGALSDAEVADLMKRLCVGAITRTELAYLVYFAFRAPRPEAVAYRASEHAHTSGAYSFTQPAIT